MLTSSAARSVLDVGSRVASRRELATLGWSSWGIRRQVEAGRWRTVGRAVVLHNGSLDADDARTAALINCGPRAVLTSFTALECLGLTGWTRPQIHVLAPVGVAFPGTNLPIALHRTASPIAAHAGRRCHRAAPAAVIAASSFPTPRPACGLLAATVQQRLIRPDDLHAALASAPRTRHRAVLIAAVGDITMGAHALSEIDFVRLCRRNGLPPPRQQAVRSEPDGHRRYLDAEWTSRRGRRVVAEVDGALHLVPRRWYDDQLRQNEIVLDGSLMLRFPTVVMRTDERLVVAQLRRAIFD